MVDDKYRAKILSAAEVKRRIGTRPRKQKVIMCHGTFDVVHPGHIRHLMYARRHGDVLIASLTCDDHIAKANLRPFVPEQLRAMNLAAFDFVDYVLIDRNPTPLQNLADLQPDIFAKGYEYVSGGLPAKTAAEKEVLDSYGGEFIFTPGDVVYSSSRLLEMAPPNLAVEKLLVLLEAENLTFADLRSALDKLPGTKVHVLGDTIVDTYTETSMIGGQTKTPTISVRHETQRDYVGGAGIVSKHLRAAGAEVYFSTVLGEDRLKQLVLDDLATAKVTVGAVSTPHRPTTNKNVITCAGHRLLKIDSVDNSPISSAMQEQLISQLRSIRADAVVFSDFRHGIFSPGTIPALIEAIPPKVFRVADSQVASRWGNICDFRHFDLITPNEREARFALGDQDSVIRPLALKLFQQAACRNLILKMGDRGLLAYRARPQGETDVRSFFAVDSFADHVQDAVGAGDALLAYATLAHVAVGNEVIAAVLGAMAAAVECEHEGNVPVTPNDLRAKIDGVEKRARFEG